MGEYRYQVLISDQISALFQSISIHLKADDVSQQYQRQMDYVEMTTDVELHGESLYTSRPVLTFNTAFAALSMPVCVHNGKGNVHSF